MEYCEKGELNQLIKINRLKDIKEYVKDEKYGKYLFKFYLQ